MDTTGQSGAGIGDDAVEVLDEESSGISLKDVQEHEGIRTFISLADRYLGEIGYTEHGFRHAGLVSNME